MDVATIVSGSWKQNCYVVRGEAGDAVVIDPGGEMARIRAHVAAEALRVHAVINTHAHYDHLGAVVPVVEAYDVPFFLHPDDADLLRRANFYRTLFLGDQPIRIPSIDVPLIDGMRLSFGELEVLVIHTPGHTPGSVSLEVGGILFTGDTIMARHVGRTDLPGGDADLLTKSVQLLADRYPADSTIYPGHGEPALLGDVLARVHALPELRG